MYKEVLRSIADIEIFPVISLAIFFVFFLIVVIRVMSVGKSSHDEMANIPLTDGTNHETTLNSSK
ncbi:MAG: CcoQ/FixQ family Cbb3-type cytochrome c oxidase assembly chaperone [Chitinophagales bacterium]|nr:CcoQ/FixQ family Cbb3-type cytochrome c oxidase assembly chaperone [Chitinophagales bacterium]